MLKIKKFENLRKYAQGGKQKIAKLPRWLVIVAVLLIVAAGAFAFAYFEKKSAQENTPSTADAQSNRDLMESTMGSKSCDANLSKLESLKPEDLSFFEAKLFYETKARCYRIDGQYAKAIEQFEQKKELCKQENDDTCQKISDESIAAIRAIQAEPKDKKSAHTQEEFTADFQKQLEESSEE